MFRVTNNHLFAIILFRLLQFAALIDSSSVRTTKQPTSLGVHMVRSPESIVAPKGDEVMFECELNLIPERLKWRFRHANSTTTDSFQYLHKADSYNISNEERMSKLRIYVSPDSLGDYQCVAWFGSAAIASVTASLTLATISVDHTNGSANKAVQWSVATKNCVVVRCGTVTSNPPAVWTFYRNGIKIPTTEFLPSSGGLVLNSVSAKDSGNYTCSAMNAITGIDVKLPQRVDISIDYTERTRPHFLIQPPSSFTAKPGETIVLECPGVGSPPPEAVWSSPDVSNIYHNRTKTLPYGLQIVNVVPEDKGTYVCRLDNGISPALVHIITLKVLTRPQILRGPAATLTDEGESLELECLTTGNPAPVIFWLINGEYTSQDNETSQEGNRLFIKHVEKRHAGIVQCVAKNIVGETSEGNLLQVNPRQIPGEPGYVPLEHFPTKPISDHSGNKSKEKRKHQPVNMTLPTRPNVTRLSDDSVMLRWSVENYGLPIEFFKVQYRMIGDLTKTIPRENWQTMNEDIPYGKRDRNHGGYKNFTSSVSNLKPDRLYKFRIIAVYSNNDNKEGNSSSKFLLQRGSALGPSKGHLPPPLLTEVEPISETAIMLHWTLTSNKSNKVDGFYAYYRPASNAGEYFKATVDGWNTRKYQIDMLEPGTAYEFKLQSFTASAASDFSTILQGRTKKTPTTASPITPSVIQSAKANEEDNSIYPVLAGVGGGGILLLLAIIAACLCMRRRKNSQSGDEDKPQLDNIQAEFVTSSVIGSQSHKPSHRMNGVLPRMNITPNPLALDGDKPATTTMSTLPYHHRTSPPSQSPIMLQKQNHPHQNQLQHHQHQHPHQHQHQHQHQHPPPVPPHQNNNHHPPTMHYQPPPSPHTPSMEVHRRTLERSARNLLYTQPGGGGVTPLDSAMNIDGLPTRIPSLRRTRRTSGSTNNNNNNNNGGVGIPIVPGSPRVQRSPMPSRGGQGVGMKKRNRLGSHTENMSSGSLNSIEV
ncbi:interference hedgehog [Eupeodes corollae]|uniref:interference hedgehog n=1 Tax=Eupeodes corollae TaxID=290404 RepID=UPI0024939223|nr:interference hedgehog [Eupeodes corollae]